MLTEMHGHRASIYAKPPQTGCRNTMCKSRGTAARADDAAGSWRMETPATTCNWILGSLFAGRQRARNIAARLHRVCSIVTFCSILFIACWYGWLLYPRYISVSTAGSDCLLTVGSTSLLPVRSRILNCAMVPAATQIVRKALAECCWVNAAIPITLYYRPV